MSYLRRMVTVILTGQFPIRHKHPFDWEVLEPGTLAVTNWTILLVSSKKNIGTINFTNDGAEVLHVYSGHDVDSYRTEVIGVILALGMHGGLPYLLDNYSAMADTMAIISKPYAESVPRKPWKRGPLKTDP